MTFILSSAYTVKKNLPKLHSYEKITRKVDFKWERAMGRWFIVFYKTELSGLSAFIRIAWSTDKFFLTELHPFSRHNCSSLTLMKTKKTRWILDGLTMQFNNVLTSRTNLKIMWHCLVYTFYKCQSSLVNCFTFSFAIMDLWHYICSIKLS